MDGRRMIRVLHIASGLEPGGAETMLYRLVAGMDRRRFTTAVVSLTGIGPVGRRLRSIDVDVTAVGLGVSVADPPRLARLARGMRRYDPDVVQTWMYHADLIGGLLGRAVTRAPVVWGIHRADPSTRSLGWRTHAIARGCARLSARVPERIVCCSRIARDTHAAFGYQATRMIVIPNGIDLGLFRPDPSRREAIRRELDVGSGPLVGHVARWHPSKDHGTFLRAAESVSREVDAQFLLCGRGTTRDNDALSREIRERDLADRVRVLGHREDVHRILPAVDVFASSSLTESFGIAIAEAMASGVPCVVTDVGIGRELVGTTGRVVPPGDPDALAGALVDLLRMTSDQRRELGRRARERIRDRFDLESTVRSYESLYVDAADHGDGSPG